ncbi:MAG: 4'-phosphopantetheinyl transferase superfamily protein [Caldilineaceae bacterium]
MTQIGWISTEQKDALSLAEAEVQLWVDSLEAPVEQMLTLRQTLAADELARAKRFHFERDRRRFIVARGRLRQLLGRYLVLPPPEIRFTYSAHGKPLLQEAQNPAALQFNLSHAGEMMLVGVTRGRAIGVDIEQVRSLDDMMGIAASFFSPRKYDVGRRARRPKRAGLFNCWTRKEAYIKAQGQGLSLPLDSFDVTLTPGAEARLLAVRNARPDEAAQWTMQAFEPVGGYVAAVVVNRV